MERFTLQGRSHVVSLMKEGKSLNYISKLTGRSKSALYYHFKKNFGRKNKDVEIDTSDDLFIGELMGLFVGDGYCFFEKKKYHYSVRFFFNNEEMEYVRALTVLLNKKLKKKPYVVRSKNVLIMRYYSKKLFSLILLYVGWGISLNKRNCNKKSRTVFLNKKDYSKKFKIGFLRGFIGSDGHISQKKIDFASSSENIIKQTATFLTDLGFHDIHYYFYKEKRENRVGMHHININKSEREKFFEVIQPRKLIKLKNASAGI